MMSAARLIVCEKSGRWAAALRREWGQPPVRLREARSLADAQQDLRDAPASILLVEVSVTGFESIVAWLLRLAWEYPQVRVVLLGDRELEAGEFVLREAGALGLVTSSSDLAATVRIARRHLAGRPSPDPTWREHLFNRLPWPESAAAKSSDSK